MRARLTILIGALVTVAGVLTAGQTGQAQTMLEAGRKLEVVDGNLSGAIKQYQTIVDKFSKTDGASTATALFRMAECYQKLGDAQARSIYERLVRDFGSEPEASEARTRLAELSGATPRAAVRTDRVAWTWTSGEHDPLAVSQDGRWFVYDTYLDGNKGEEPEIADLETGRSSHVMDAQPGYAVDDASVSRDGKHVACTTSSRTNGKGTNELRIVDLDGSPSPPSRILSSTDQDTSFVPLEWTADARRLLVSIYRKDKLVEIGLLSVNDGSFQLIKSAGQIGNAHLSPNDKFVAFGVGGADPHISVIGVDGSGETTVVESRFKDAVEAWSPDSGRILFTSDRAGPIGLYAQRVDGSKPQGAPEILVPDFGRATIFNVSASGALLYSPWPPTGDGGGLRTASVNFSTGVVVSPPVDVFDEAGVGRILAPEFSPDGKSLAYVWIPTGMFRGESHVIVKALDSNARRTFRTSFHQVAWLRWAPGGKILAVGVVESPGRYQIWRLDPTTGETAAVAVWTAEATVGFVGWRADGRGMYFTRTFSADQRSALLEYDVATGSAHELFRTAMDPSAYPSFQIAPDGQTVYYRLTTAQGGPPLGRSVFIARDLVSGAEHQVAEGNLGGVSLSPDGKSIATGVTDAASRSRSIRLIPVDGTPSRDLFRVDVPQDYLAGTSTINPLGMFAWSTDSQSIVAQKLIGSGNRISKRELWWVPADSRSAAKQLDLGNLSDLRIAGDGRRVAFQSLDPRPTAGYKAYELHILEHFLPGSK